MEGLDASQEKMITDTIEQYGVFVAGFEETGYFPAFAFSIGLWEKLKHPEIICFGLQVQTLQQIIADIANRVLEGEPVIPETNDDTIFEDSRSVFLNVDPRNLKDYFGTAIKYYKGQEFPALQLIWTDRNDVFPWEENFEEELRYKQPLLDRNAEFRFFEPANLGAYTSRQWLEDRLPILTVVHDSDGDWQFLTGDEEDDDIRVVALQEIIRSDLSLNAVFDLDYGEMAERKEVGGPWEYDDFAFDEEE